MPTVNESLSFIKNGIEHHGIIIGVEQNYFWLLVPELKSVFVGNPNKIHTYAGRKIFAVFDHHEKLENLFSETNEQKSHIFEYSKNPEPIKSLLKTYKLLIQA